jgi:hypothetical protein
VRDRTVRRATVLGRTARSAVAAVAVLAAFALAGCGGSSTQTTTGSRVAHKAAAKKPPVCLPKAEAALSRSLGPHVKELSQSPSIGGNAEPQCTFKVGLTGGRRLTVIANLDTGPQPYFRLERTSVEATQQFSVTRNIPAPEVISGLGLDADWYPEQRQIQTTDGITLITVTVNWAGVTQRRRRTVAEAVARAYLHHPFHSPP